MKSTLLFLSLVCSSAFARRHHNSAKHAVLKNVLPTVKSQHPPSVEKQIIPDYKSIILPSDPPALNDVPTIVSKPKAVRVPVGPCSATGNAAGSTCVNNPTGTGSVYTGITSPKRI